MEQVTENAKVKKASKKKAHEAEGFDPLKWDGVKLEKKKTYYCIRPRVAPGETALAIAENPLEVVEAKFLNYDRGWYDFDDGRLVEPPYQVLTFMTEDRERHIFPNTPDGKKKAQAVVTHAREYNQELIKGVTQKDDEKAKAALDEIETTDDFTIAAIALGGSEKTHKNRTVGKSKAKKRAAIFALRPAYFEKKATGPIPDRKK